MGEQVRLTSLTTGGGCACKVPLGTLETVLGPLGRLVGPGGGDDSPVLVGAQEADDGAVIALDEARGLIATVDFFPPMVDDPVDFGRVAAANAISDVYAMGGVPTLALNVTAWPYQTLGTEALGEVLRGAAQVAGEARCVVGGGHTIEDEEPKFGMAVIGTVDLDRLFRLDAARPGDLLVLTKPLGSGVICSGLKRGLAPDAAVAEVTALMTTLNAQARDLGHRLGVRAATDVTGFGLLGHLHRMARASGVAAEVSGDDVAVLDAALRLVEAGVVPGGTRRNIEFMAPYLRTDRSAEDPRFVALHDAQTSGGLLLAVPAQARDGIPDEVAGWEVSVVGTVTEGRPGHVALR